MELRLHNPYRDTAARTEHKDLGQVAANQIVDGLPVINRTKTLLSPFAPIIKTPCFSENSGNLTGYAIEIEDPDAETGFRHLGNVSEKYLLMTNAEVRAVGLEIAESSGIPFTESRGFFDGGRFAYVSTSAPRWPRTSASPASPTPSGSRSSSAPRTTRAGGSRRRSWAKDSSATTGCSSGEFFARVSFKHTTGSQSEDWREVVRHGLRLVHRAPADLSRFCQGLRRLRQAQTSDKRLREAWALFPQMGDSIVGKVMRRYVEHEEPTLFGLLNAGTQVFWHNPKQTAADWAHNDAFVSGLVTYANERLN